VNDHGGGFVSAMSCRWNRNHNIQEKRRTGSPSGRYRPLL